MKINLILMVLLSTMSILSLLSILTTTTVYAQKDANNENIKLLFICSLISKNIATDDEKLERIIF